MAVRASQAVAEVLVRAGAAPMRASQTQAEVLARAGLAPLRGSQVLAEALVRAGLAPRRVSQAIAETLVRGGLTPRRASQILVEILIGHLHVTTPPVYPNVGGSALAPTPALPGLAYSLIKRPVFYNASAKSGSGWQVRIGYASTPTWEWDLTYEVLRDGASAELPTILGFFLAMGGDLVPFLFLDPDDNTVTAQPIGTTDGTATTWTLVRSFGASQVGTEPIGYVWPGAPFAVYLDGTLQSPTTYDVVTTTPVQQQIRFHSTPGAGHAITVDMSYAYYAHFKDGSNDFEKFMNQLWLLKKVTLESLRG